jgi:hypothetical protein
VTEKMSITVNPSLKAVPILGETYEFHRRAQIEASLEMLTVALKTKLLDENGKPDDS